VVHLHPIEISWVCHGDLPIDWTKFQFASPGSSSWLDNLDADHLELSLMICTSVFQEGQACFSEAGWPVWHP
jgi:hypothetical protein